MKQKKNEKFSIGKIYEVKYALPPSSGETIRRGPLIKILPANKDVSEEDLERFYKISKFAHLRHSVVSAQIDRLVIEYDIDKYIILPSKTNALSFSIREIL